MEYITVPFLEVKALESNQFEGYGSTFGNVDLGGDVVMKGAFKDSLAQYKDAGDYPLMFWMHRPDQIPGKWLDMNEDDRGLKMKGELLPTTLGKDTGILLKARAVKGLSIGFSIDSPDDYEFKDGVRLLHKINLWETSVVSMPMNPKAKINAVKARLHAKGLSITDLKRDLEKIFREKGFSKSESVALASRALAPEEFDLGAMPRNELGETPSVEDEKPGEIPEADIQREAETPEDLEATTAAKKLLRDEEIRREARKIDQDDFVGSLKAFHTDLIALSAQRRLKRLIS